MAEHSIVRKDDFSEFAQVHPDSKHRISLGKLDQGATAYRVFRNSFGQILLDPQASVPAYEAWIFRNPEHLASIQRGLQDAARGRVKPISRNSSAAPDEE